MYESVYEEGPTLTSGHTVAPEQELSTASGWHCSGRYCTAGKSGSMGQLDMCGFTMINVCVCVCACVCVFVFCFVLLRVVLFLLFCFVSLQIYHRSFNNSKQQTHVKTMISWCWFLHHFLVKTVYRLFHFFSNRHPERTLCGGRVVSTQEQTKQPPKIWSGKALMVGKNCLPFWRQCSRRHGSKSRLSCRMPRNASRGNSNTSNAYTALSAAESALQFKLHRRVERRVTQRKTIKPPSKSNNTLTRTQ